MKRTIYLTAITLATIACIICGMMYHSGGFFSMKPDFKGKTETIFQDSGEVSEITLDSEAMDVKIYTGEKLEIAYGGNEKLKPEIALKDGVLAIKQRGKSGRGFSLFGLWNNQPRLVITIPADVKLQKISCQIDVCDLGIYALNASSAELHANVGDTDVENCTFEQTNLSLNTGDLKAKDSVLGSGTVSMNTGDVDVEYCDFSDLQVTNDVGDIDVNLKDVPDAYTMDISTDLGDVEVFGKDAGKSYSQQGSGPKLSVRTHIGDVDVK